MLAKKMWLTSLIIVLVTNSCISTQGIKAPSPPSSHILNINWIESDEYVCISKEDAVRLEQWLIEMDFFVHNT